MTSEDFLVLCRFPQKLPLPLSSTPTFRQTDRRTFPQSRSAGRDVFLEPGGQEAGDRVEGSV